MSASIKKRVEEVQSRLCFALENLEEVVSLQKQWLYMRPVFTSQDLSNKLPIDAARFQTVDAFYRNFMQALIAPLLQQYKLVGIVYPSIMGTFDSDRYL